MKVWTKTSFRPQILAASEATGISAQIIASVIHQESAGNPWAIRFEPDFHTRLNEIRKRSVLKGRRPDMESLCTTKTEIVARSTSWGLMQIMGNTGREMGFDAVFLSELLDPAINVMLGAKYLARCAENAIDTKQMLLKYNGGGNLRYPIEVLKWLDTGASDYLLL